MSIFYIISINSGEYYYKIWLEKSGGVFNISKQTCWKDLPSNGFLFANN